MTNEDRQLSTTEILGQEIALYDEKIKDMKSKDSKARFDVENFNYIMGRRDGMTFVKLLLQDLKK